MRVVDFIRSECLQTIQGFWSKNRRGGQFGRFSGLKLGGLKDDYHQKPSIYQHFSVFFGWFLGRV